MEVSTHEREEVQPKVFLFFIFLATFLLWGHTCERRQGPSMDGSPAHCRALCEHLWVWYLPQGYHSSILNGVLAPPLTTKTPSMFLSAPGVEPRTGCSQQLNPNKRSNPLLKNSPISVTQRYIFAA